MLDVYDILLGGAAPMAIAMVAFGVGWAATRRAGVAWSGGVVLGFAAGLAALEAGNAGITHGLKILVQPAEAKHWTPIIGLLAILPALAGWLGVRFRALRWLLAAVLCLGAPLWLLWGSRYLPSAEDRASGFLNEAWSYPQAAAIIATVAAAMLVAWRLWEVGARETHPMFRSLLAVATLVGAAAAAGLTGSFVYAQMLGVLAASIGGCTVAAWLLGAKADVEASAGPVIAITGSMLYLAVFLSKLPALYAAGLAVAMTASAGYIPGFERWPPRIRHSIRAAVCFIPLSIVLWLAAADFIEMQRQQQEEAESNPYLNL